MNKKGKKPGDISRRDFIEKTGKAAIAAASLPVVGRVLSGNRILRAGEAAEGKEGKARMGVKGNARSIMLKKGLVVEGTGRKPFVGSVVISGNMLAVIGPGEASFSGEVVDCTGLVIAPGIIDMHSHMDWVMPARDHPRLAAPFTAQGVTSFIGGNCGFGSSAYRKNSAHIGMLKKRTEGMYHLSWNTFAEYNAMLRSQGISHNIMNCVGYGTTRTTMRGYEPGPLKPDEMKEMLYLLEEAMEQGACGVSFGLQYEPGVFATMEEIKQVARLVKKKDRIITVHTRAYSSLSGTYPIKLFGTPHNLMAMDEMLQVTRDTGVRMQLSHLIYVGSKTFKTCDDALERIDRSIRDGLDVKFDTYAYHCGTSIINVFLPAWFLAKVPAAFDDPKMLKKLRNQIRIITLLLGFGYRDIQITDAKHPDLVRYNGMFLKDIARARKMDEFDCYIDMARKSEGKARVLNHRYSSLANVKDMMRHPASLFMTDAAPALKGVQNPAVYGNFPLFFQYARDHKLISIEEAVRKMSGAAAERFGVKKRGILADGYAADVMVVDPAAIRDNNTLYHTDRAPSGIALVFNNGRPVCKDGGVETAGRAGQVLES